MTDLSVFPEAAEWARKKLAEDRPFIEREARFGSPIIKNIANLILAIEEKMQ